MSLPELLSGAAGDETVVARVPLGGDDVLAVTPTRTLVYRGDGLLSDESVEEYGHDVERIAVSTSRRKSKLVLGYGLDGEETLSIPTGQVDDVLHPVLAGVLAATGVTESGESVVRTFRFSELTLVITDRRLVKHVGSPVWDEEFEEFPYADLTDLDFEEGTVATAVVLTHDGRSERFKAPNESARAVRETLVDAVCSFHDVGSLEEFRIAVTDEEADGEDGASTGTTDFGDGPDPLSTSPAADASSERSPPRESAPTADPSSALDESVSAGGGTTSEGTIDGETAGGTAAVDQVDQVGESGDVGGDTLDDGLDTGYPTDPAGGTDGSGGATDSADSVGSADPVEPDGFDGSAFETAGVEDDGLAAEVAELRRTVEAQGDRLDRQSELIEKLIEELRRGR